MPFTAYIAALIIPVRPQSKFSLFKNVEQLQDISYRDEYDDARLLYNELLQTKLYNDMEIESTEMESAKIEMNKLLYKSLILDKALPLIWVLGIMVFVIYITAEKIKLDAKLKKNIVNGCPEQYNNILTECKSCLHIKKDMKIVVQKYINTPALMGVISPQIILPVYITEMDEQNIKYVVLHELGHYKRLDMILNYMMMLLQAIYWFNPMIWLMFKLIRQDMEIANDSFILRVIGREEYKNYGLSLIEVLGRANGIPMASRLVCMVDAEGNMERRITMIKLRKKFIENKLIIGCVSIVIVAAIGVFFLTSGNAGTGERSQQLDIQIIGDDTAAFLYGTWEVTKFLGFNAITKDDVEWPDGEKIIGKTVIIYDDFFSTKNFGLDYAKYAVEVNFPVYEIRNEENGSEFSRFLDPAADESIRGLSEDDVVIMIQAESSPAIYVINNNRLIISLNCDYFELERSAGMRSAG